MKISKLMIFSIVFALSGLTAFSQMGGGMGPGGDHGSDPGSFPGWQGHELEHNLVLPQVAVGESVSMTLILSNMGGPRQMGWLTDEQDYTVTGTLRFFSDAGAPLSVEINGVSGSEFPFDLGPSALTYMEVSAPTGTEFEKGWLLVEVDDTQENDWGNMDGHSVSRGERVMVSAYYSIFGSAGELESQVAVTPRIFSHGTFASSIVPAQYSQTPSGLIRTGIAVVNPTGVDTSVTLRLIGVDGQEVSHETLTLSAGTQQARFVDELFPSLPADFQGRVEISSGTQGIVTMGLLQTGLVTTSLPTRHFGSWQQSQ